MQAIANNDDKHDVNYISIAQTHVLEQASPHKPTSYTFGIFMPECQQNKRRNIEMLQILGRNLIAPRTASNYATYRMTDS